MKSKSALTISWIAQILAVVIMGQSLFFKFSAHPASIAIFTEIGIEPIGRYLIGAIELIACLLLLRNASAHYGALLGAGVMGGAVVGHITELGWSGERGELGGLAILVLLCCVTVMYLRRMSIPFIGTALKESK